MARIKNGKRKIIASFSLIILSLQTFYPGIAYAVTSGPSQPEMQKFEPAGVNDMVDLFTGDFKQNIPLMDVGGYPVNLSYQSGTGTEDEGSWVGAGWSLNAGAVTRNMRGLPDDFNGDKIEKTYKREPYKKIGGEVMLKAQIFGHEFGESNIRVGIYKDNYWGVGAEIGASLGFSLGKSSKTPFTASFGVSSDSRNGADITPSFELAANYDILKEINMGPLTGGFKYNTRDGLKQYSLATSFNPIKALQNTPANLTMSATNYFTPGYTPAYNVNSRVTNTSFNIDWGLMIGGLYGGVGAKGYTYQESIIDEVTNASAYGYMNYATGRDNRTALLDFNREKDGVYIPSTPAIPMPVATPDFFMATAQSGSQQFRPFYGGNYAIFDKEYKKTSTEAGGGATVGAIVEGGGRIEYAQTNAKTGKWSDNNYFLDVSKISSSSLIDENVYVKQVGEHAAVDKNFTNLLDNTNAESVAVIGTSTNSRTTPVLIRNDKTSFGVQQMKRNVRDIRTTTFSYLPANLAARNALDKNIVSYASNGLGTNISRMGTFTDGSTVFGKRQAHHISEVTVTDNEGKRMIYGIPVYNVSQEDVTFSTTLKGADSEKETAKREGMITYLDDQASTANTEGRDKLYSKEKLPPYATSYLLTGILSPDYVDVKRDGITDDDLGTAVKFNYTKLSDFYKWRAPFGDHMANYNEGFKSDLKDDKASYSYGVKEIWYMRSIESKTMVAIFKVSDREDACGVNGTNGGINKNVKLKKLDEIALYNKAEWISNPYSAVPVKVVHFEYDYSLSPNMINNSGKADPHPKTGVDRNIKKGKLTLKKVYFTFGNNGRGVSNPYLFEYDVRPISDVPGLPANTDLPAGDADSYMPKQDDRWGTYKQSFYNRIVNGVRGMSNAEYPYTLQEDEHTAYSERELANRFASKWQLTKITTPTGGVINIEYESDDYAYVQNRRAMQMCFISGIEAEGQDKGLINANKIIVELPFTVPTDDALKKRYLDGVDKIFFKVLADVDNNSHYEYVYGYATINLADCHVLNNGHSASIGLTKVDGYNPIAKAGWQMVRSDLPQYAFDGYDNSDVNLTVGAVKALVQAYKNRREITQPFDSRASSNKFSDKIQLNKSIIRLTNPDYKKIGGGARVKKITISDEWALMSDVGGAAPGKTASYGQLYKYTIKDNSIKDENNNAVEISSGVASYEPQIGNEENPFHEPVGYTEKVHWSNNRYHYVEKPYCESYFPAPQVGYRKVTVINIGDNGAQETGYTENDFYTAKEFPVIVDNTPLTTLEPNSSLTLKLFSSVSYKRVITSQGFKVELNDMHGKPKAVTVFNKSGNKISSVEYFYNVVNNKAAVQELDNRVSVLKSEGTVLERNDADVNTGATIATDIEMISDFRESSNERVGTSVGLYAGFSRLGFIIPFIFGSIAKNTSITSDDYNSAAVVKVIHRYGLLKKIRTMQNGSTTEVENMVWDAQTGDVVLTKNQNEYNDVTYAFHYPAYMMYDGMGHAYKNLGLTFSHPGGLISSSLENYLVPGDEVIGTTNGKRFWLGGEKGNYHLLDENGDICYNADMYKIVRSGRRNLLGASVGSIVCMNYPVVSGKISFVQERKVLDSKAAVFSDEWGLPVNNEYMSYSMAGNCSRLTYCFELFFNRLIMQVNETSPFYRRGIFSLKEDNKTVDDMNVPEGLGHLYFCRSNFLDGRPATDFPYYLNTPHSYLDANDYRRYYLQAGDIATMGDYQIVFDQVDADFNTLANMAVDESEMSDEYEGYVGYPQTSYTLNNYCLSNNGSCSFTLKKRIGTPTGNTPYADACSPTDGVTYKNILQFHVVVPPVLVTQCQDPINKQFNPYYRGILGNWHSMASLVYKTNRSQDAGNKSQAGGTDLRRNGYYLNFNPYWIFSSTKLNPNGNDANRWIRTNTTTSVDQKGNEIESKNALGQYSSALYGYQQSLTTAVAANARRNEIMFDGFEDYFFTLQGGPGSSCPLARHFDWGIVNGANGSNTLATELSHTGKYSYKINTPLTVTKSIGAAEPPEYLYTLTGDGKYILNANEQAKGFSPVPGKKYVLSMWVYENGNMQKQLNNLAISVNGQTLSASVPVVEKWKRIEVPFTQAAGSTLFTLTLSPSSTVYIDDIRIFPYDGQINTYVYNPTNMRLMATLDENNFATLYEYDDEGTPIRVKKETDRGIMTIKENRSFYRRR